MASASTSPRRCWPIGTRPADNDEQFLRAFNWDGKELTPAFEVDFRKEKLGRAHHMKFGSKAFKAAYDGAGDKVANTGQ